MATRQYIGARYVPKFYQNSVDGSTQWQANVVYEPLIWVTLTNGHMYISKKQVPATVGTPAENVDYWLDIGSYNGITQELQDEIDALEANLAKLEERVVGKKIIFIGDSYQWGGGLSGDGNKWSSGWLGICTRALGLTENVDFWHDEYPGRGFTTATSYLDMIQALSIGTTPASEITDIIVTGGLNDTSGVNSLSTAIPAFVSYCKTTYPKAKVHIGYIGNYFNNSQLRFNGRNVSVYYGRYAQRSGAAFITNSQYLLHEDNYYSVDETWHPNLSGHTLIAEKLVNYIIDGCFDATSGYRTLSFTNDGVFDTIIGTPAFTALVNNNISIIKSQSLLRFNYTTSGTTGISIADNQQIKLGTLAACGINPSIGEYTSCPVIASFAHFNGSEFESRVLPTKLIYENDAQENRCLYIKALTPETLNVFNIRIAPFDLIADTNLT